MNYFIYCEKHTPLKLKRLLENKEKKYQEEIIKFTRTIEKYYETYNSEHRIKCIQIAKTKKSFKKYFKKPRMERHKDTKLFFSMIKEHFNSNDENKHIIFLKKNEKIELENSPTYEILEINKPKNIITSIPKNDFFWKTFKYKTLEPAQTYKKYYSSLRKIGVNLFQSHSKLNESNRKTDKYNRKKIKEKIRTSKTKKPKILEDPNKIYCICRKPYKEGEKMMGN